MANSDIHPDTILASFLSKGGRAERIRTLNALHAICRRHAENGSRDFSISVIGRIAEEQDLFVGRTLYNASSADYRALIVAWANYTGSTTSPKVPKPEGKYAFLEEITNHALRQACQVAFVDREKLKAQNNLLKSKMQITVDRRPATITSAGSVAAGFAYTPEPLTSSEREALEKAISADFLADEGWHEGHHGEILKANGRKLFEVGFVKAIRKVLRR